MVNALYVALTAFALGGAVPDQVPFEKCREVSKQIGNCHWQSGRFIAVNGSYSSRIILRSGKHRTIAIVEPGQDEPWEYAPHGVDSILSRSPNQWQVGGEFLLCPLIQPNKDIYLRENQLKTECLAGAKNLIGIRSEK